MTEFRRFAVYDLGPAPLARWGAAWLGRDVVAGQDVDPLGPDGWTRTPRRYGFHATIKAPFRLADGLSAADLGVALDDLCRALAAVQMPRLRLTEEGGFLALTPPTQPPSVTDLAAQVVAALDRFRAPLNPDDIARRQPHRLSALGRENLMRWGYPHVMGDFRYHMTLTGDLPPADLSAARAAIEPQLNGLLPDPHPVAALALMGEDADGRFHLIRRCPLAPVRAAATAGDGDPSSPSPATSPSSRSSPAGSPRR